MKHLAVTQNRKPDIAADRDTTRGPQQPSGASSRRGMVVRDHSFHSAQRSQHYHKNVVEPNAVRFGDTKMSRLENQPQSNEDETEKGHRL
jgi:hypothetical protein